MLQSVLSREMISEDNLKSFRKSFDSSNKLLSLQYRLLTNDLSESSELIKKIEKSSKSSSIEFRLLQIFYFLEVQDYSKADHLLNHPLKNPDSITSTSLNWLKYDSFKKQLQYQDCLCLLDKKIPSTKGPRVLFERIFLLNELHQQSEAISLLKSFKSSSPSDLLEMCLAYTEGNYEACQSLTEDYLKTHPVTVDFLALKAFCQVKKNELTSALETLDEALTLNNKIKSLWTLSGITYYRLGLVSDSFLCFSKAISLNPDSVHEWFNFSLIFSSKQPEVFKKIQQKIKRMKRFNDEHQLDFFFPSIDFSEFGKRKSEFVPKPFKDLEIVFVMPKVKKVKKVSFKCTSEDRDINSLASVLQGFKKKSKGLKKNRVESTLIPVKRKRKE